MKVYLVTVHYVSPKGVQIMREFISDGNTEKESEEKIMHLLEDNVWMEDFSMESVECSFPFELF